MKILRGFLFLSLLVGCSALNAQQRQTLANNQVANIESFRLDYAAVSCNGCADCEAMQAAVTRAANAAGDFDPLKDTKEEQVRAYMQRLRVALPAVPQSCGCAEDAAFCPSAKTVLEASLENLVSLEKSLGMDSTGKSFLGGLLGLGK